MHDVRRIIRSIRKFRFLNFDFEIQNSGFQSIYSNLWISPMEDGRMRPETIGRCLERNRLSHALPILLTISFEKIVSDVRHDAIYLLLFRDK